MLAAALTLLPALLAIAGRAVFWPTRPAVGQQTAGGWGRLVTIAHAGRVRSMYAHLSRVDVRLGQRVATSQHVGLIGATGDATGPHLHFELRVDGAAVDPLTALR